ncbi:extracellular solute-binding protein [Cohnella soli]|uniref:Extracellular solute-binding protein n=1 Tax=Cohnella soli TaxID=425005 RepID=A0ABW0I4H1_9BACL
MKSTMLKFGSTWIAAAIAFALLAGCVGNAGKEEGISASADTPNISKKVEVKMYLAGDASADSPLVEQEINKLLEKDLNATIKIINIPWSDWGTKYPLILTSGEKYDLVYASNWAGFSDYARKGAFMAIDDLLPKYAPATVKQLPPQAWDEVKIDGKIVGIPSYQDDYLTDAMVIRGDLREKYGVPPVTDLDSLGVYLEAVKKNEPDLVPLDANASEDLLIPATPYEIIDGAIYAYSYEDLKKGKINHLAFMDAFEPFVNRMKEWNDKGYFSKGMLTNKGYSYGSYEKGTSAVGVGNTGQIFNVLANTQITHPEWKSEFVSFRLKTKAGVHKLSFMSEGMAVGRFAENPERALMILDKFRTDKTYYNLLHYGIEGRNYIINAEGKRENPPGVTPDKNGYLANNNGQWGFVVTSMETQDANEWPDKRKIINPQFDEFTTPDLMGRFVFNRDNVKAELAAMSQVYIQYAVPLRWGFTKDPAKDLENLRSKLKAAGSDKVLAEMRQQLLDYFKP